MKRRSFLALLGLAPAAVHVASKTVVAPDDVPLPPTGIPLPQARVPALADYPVTGGVLKSANGRLVINLSAGTLFISADKFPVTG